MYYMYGYCSLGWSAVPAETVQSAELEHRDPLWSLSGTATGFDASSPLALRNCALRERLLSLSSRLRVGRSSSDSPVA